MLIAVSCELGARVGRAEEETVRALAHFGYDVGMAFQITDDILDFTGTEKTLGKPAGSDMRQGNITLPALYALHCSPVGDDLRRWIDRPQEERKVSEAVRLIRKSGGIEYARDLANRYLQRAEQRLEPLPNSKSKRSLLDIARFIGERRF